MLNKYLLGDFFQVSCSPRLHSCFYTRIWKPYRVSFSLATPCGLQDLWQLRGNTRVGVMGMMLLTRPRMCFPSKWSPCHSLGITTILCQEAIFSFFFTEGKGRYHLKWGGPCSNREAHLGPEPGCVSFSLEGPEALKGSASVKYSVWEAVRKYDGSTIRSKIFQPGGGSARWHLKSLIAGMVSVAWNWS